MTLTKGKPTDEDRIVFYAECRVAIPTDCSLRTRSGPDRTLPWTIFEAKAQGPGGAEAVVVLLARHPVDTPETWRAKCEAAARELRNQLDTHRLRKMLEIPEPTYPPEECPHTAITYQQLVELRSGRSVRCRGCDTIIDPVGWGEPCQPST